MIAGCWCRVQGHARALVLEDDVIFNPDLTLDDMLQVPHSFVCRLFPCLFCIEPFCLVGLANLLVGLLVLLLFGLLFVALRAETCCFGFDQRI